MWALHRLQPQVRIPTPPPFSQFLSSYWKSFNTRLPCSSFDMLCTADSWIIEWKRLQIRSW